MLGCKMAICGILIDPQLLRVNEAWVEYIFGVTLFRTAFLGAASCDHFFHDGSCRVYVVSGEADSSYKKTVARVIGERAGTGGSAGVGYLAKALDLRFFPELWTMRTKMRPGAIEGK